MTATSDKLAKAVEAYCAELHRVRASGGATGERSSYGPLANLLNAVGVTLKPRVFCVQELADQGAGHPDFGLYGARQVQKGRPREQQIPERGVVEVKGVDDDAWLTAASHQVSRYRDRYRLVLVTNLRHFVLVGESSTGRPTNLETFQLSESSEAFWQALDKPQTFARTAGAGLGEYLARALSHRAALAEPKDLAWLLASYARDGLSRVEAAGEEPRLTAVRSALEEALGVRFEGDKGARFFRSTLVQTLFYGIFSAWVLWARQSASSSSGFDWRTAVWHLRSPVLAALFQQLAQPGRLQPLGLVEVLDWTAAALERVDRTAFFSRFNTGEAVPYFYEPFLEAFDPALRKELGVWYTPTEVVRAMVARVDNALKQDLGISDGLAAENVVVLDPCCGTGAYLAEVLHRIAANLDGQGLGALAGARVKAAATARVFGFEIMPAPFVIAHLQVGLTLQELDAPLAEDGNERAGVFLTNALTGWEPHTNKPLPFPELEEERDRAERVKQAKPILVILGNPPYNGFAGLAVDEERALSNAYRQTKRVRKPEGQGLNDLYVRFFRMAERRIVEKTGQGVICFISNYSWLDGLSFTGMRERFLEAFDAIRIDCLNGDKYKTGKVAPDGSPDPSVFSSKGNPVGIQVGTAIATLVRKTDHKPTHHVSFRHLWGPAQAKREELLATAETTPGQVTTQLVPNLPLGLPFVQTDVSEDYCNWPALPDLFPKSFPGVQTKRDSFLIDIDLNRLQARVTEYFDADASHGELARRYPAAMKNSSGFIVRDARLVRDSLIARGGPTKTGFVRHAYRPFDQRWLYWEPGHGLLGRPVPDYMPHVFGKNLWLVTQQKPRREWSPPQLISRIGCLDLIDRGATCIPTWLHDDDITNTNGQARRPNLSIAAQNYLTALDSSVEDLFHHVLAVLHDPAYRQANAGALRMGWPRIPLPGWPKGEAEGAAAELAHSSARGHQLAALLNPDVPVVGVTQAPFRPEMAVVAVPTTTHGRNMAGGDFAVMAGWGHFGKGDAVMPGQGRVVERPFTPEERSAMARGYDKLDLLGATTLDVYLNDRAFWRNVPLPVWRYKLGGYQVLKKWLSYRERGVLGRALRAEEVLYFAEMGRRIGGILGLRGGGME